MMLPHTETPPDTRNVRLAPPPGAAGGPLRVLFLADAHFDDLPGGSRVVARELACGLAGRGHDVTFLVARQNAHAPGDTAQGGVRIVRYGGAGQPLAFVRQGRAACARLWAEGPFDVVHTHFAYAALGPARAVPRGVPHVRSFYGPWDQEGWVEDTAQRRRPLGEAAARVKRGLRRRVEADCLRRSRAVVVLSEHSRREVESFGYPDRGTHLFAGGADVCRFRPPQDKAATRAALGLPEGRRLLLSVRRLAPRMGLDNLVAAMPAVIAGCPDALLLIGGQGPERARLEALVARLGLEHHVRLLGFVPDRDLAAYYQAADLFVLPTLALEGFGLVTAEALACGLPVVGTDVGATPEILRGLDPRLIIPDTTPAAISATILRFLGGDWASSLTPERLHRFVRERYTWDKHVGAIESLYASLITETSTGTRHA